MRRKPLLFTIVVFVVLTTAGAAAAGNGGFAPIRPNSPNATRISHAYYLVFGLTAAIFVLVEAALIVFVWKYRSRGRSRAAEGPQLHGHTRLELIWTAAPVVILAVIAAFVFYQLPGIANAPAATNAIHITVEGHQYYWQYDYPNGSRSIDQLHVPVGRVVDLNVTSADVIHSWWIPALGGKIQALPGNPNHTWFKAEREGVYGGQCAELCGLYHADMAAHVIVTSEAEYDSYVATTAKADLGRSEYVGACAACHGISGQGGYGPALVNSPLLVQPAGLAQRVRQGGILMPAVGNTWTQAQMLALAAYVKKHIYKGAASGG